MTDSIPKRLKTVKRPSKSILFHLSKQHEVCGIIKQLKSNKAKN